MIWYQFFIGVDIWGEGLESTLLQSTYGQGLAGYIDKPCLWYQKFAGPERVKEKSRVWVRYPNETQ